MDRVLPIAPYRQWVLTFPWELRFKLAVDKRFLSKMLRAFLLTLFAWQRRRGRQLGFQGQTGAVTFIQRFGGALNLNPHFHSLLPDGLFVAGDNGQLRFEELPARTNADIQRLLQRLVRRFKRLAQGEFDPDEQPDWDEQQQSLLDCTGEALRLPSDRSSQPQLWPEPPASPLCARLEGFSLHAARRVETQDRDGLERLCRYGLRAPFSLERFSLTSDRKVAYKLSRPWPKPGGRTELLLEPTALLRRLSALIPAPYSNLVRYHGVFHNRSKACPFMPLPNVAPALDADRAPNDDPSSEPAKPNNRSGWAQLLRRVLDIDALSCPACATAMLVVAFITCPEAIRRILNHLKLDATAPTRAPAKFPKDQNLDLSKLFPEQQLHPTQQTHKAKPAGRGPPPGPLS